MPCFYVTIIHSNGNASPTFPFALSGCQWSYLPLNYLELFCFVLLPLPFTPLHVLLMLPITAAVGTSTKKMKPVFICSVWLSAEPCSEDQQHPVAWCPFIHSKGCMFCFNGWCHLIWVSLKTSLPLSMLLPKDWKFCSMDSIHQICPHLLCTCILRTLREFSSPMCLQRAVISLSAQSCWC